jgi:hypothetical protein
VGHGGEGVPDHPGGRRLLAPEGPGIAGGLGHLATQHAVEQRDQVATKGQRRSGRRVCVCPQAAQCRRAMGTRCAAGSSSRASLAQAARSRI